jgi:hypothetical protein
MMRVLGGSMALGLRAIVVAGCFGGLVGCVAKEGTEVQARGTADSGTSAPATRPTNTNAATGPTAGGNAAAQSAPSTSAGDVGQAADSTTKAPGASDTTHRRHP